MSLQSSISQQLHNTIANKFIFYTMVFNKDCKKTFV